MEEILRYAVLSVAVGVSALATIVLTAIIIARLREQKKLHSSIQLVQLKTFRLHCIVFAIAGGLFLLFLVGQTLDSASPERRFLIGMFGLKKAEFIIMSVAIEVFLFAFTFFYAICTFSKCAVVDKGVYTCYGFVGWSDIYDYIVNENNGRVIFTVNKESFSSMRGTTQPYKVQPEEISKIVFILNKNKNKFGQ